MDVVTQSSRDLGCITIGEHEGGQARNAARLEPDSDGTCFAPEGDIHVRRLVLPTID